jgi:hypothetical protein
MTIHTDPHILADRKKALEEQFFARQERELVERVRREEAAKARRESLAEASGIRDAAVLDRLAGLDLDGATIAALGLVPLVAVAWADGSLKARERSAVLRAAGEAGVSEDTASYVLLESWLARPPGAELLGAWKDYAGALAQSLDEAERESFRREMVSRARSVAEAAGGFLGMGKISDAEEAKIAELERALS